MTKATAKQRREWHERVTAMPTRADIDRCKECWPKDWEDKCAFHNGQVATLLAEVERQHADNERLRAREAALVEIARAVSGASITVFLDGLPLQYDMVDVAWAHLQDQARALLAAGEQAAQGEA